VAEDFLDLVARHGLQRQRAEDGVPALRLTHEALLSLPDIYLGEIGSGQVEVRVDDTWHHGQLEAWRRDVDGWRAFVRYSTGVGMRRLEWLESDKLKAGVEGLTRAAANVLGRHGIRVNAVRSGFIDTDMLRYAWNVPPEVPFPIGSSYESNVPLGRVGQPAVSAAAIVWLCSRAASYVTGTCLDVDGGALAD
jgi:NAD(P)-dependent dehydrogenase (short-subunit alcohol dehydrogenase family)